MLIKTASLRRKYGPVIALKGLDLSIETPGVYVILGPNGAGKTTFLKILSGLVKPSSGTATINGMDAWEKHPEVAAKMGTLIEQPEFHPYMTAREILTFHARLKGIADIEPEIRKVSLMTEITGYLDRKSGGFSRGMKQRLALASALLNDPEILLLDEPTFGLDPLGMILIRNVIKKLNTEYGKTVILSTHLINEASELADRILIFSKGELVYDRPADSEQKLSVTLKGDVSLISNLKPTVNGNVVYFDLAGKRTINNILAEILKKGLDIVSIRVMDNLEQIYVKMQGGNQPE